jgi:hypothetical protein
MLLRLKSALRTLIGRIHSSVHPQYVSSRVRKALALNRRNEARVDGLELKRLKTILQVEWIAREVHPWDRRRHPMSVRRLYTLQCLEDAQAAIERLFDQIPDVEAIEVRVFSAASQPPVMTGTVHRKDLMHAVHSSPGMNLKSLGLRFKMSDWRLEPLPAVEDHGDSGQAPA